MQAAFQMQTLIMGWQLYDLTRDPMALGLIGLAEAVPFLGLTLLGGWAADRWSRQLLSALATSVLLLAALLLLGLNWIPALLRAWPFYLIQFVSGIGRAFYRPATQSLGTDLIPPEAYGNAATWRSSVMQSARVAGPALGGILYAYGSARLAYGAEAALMAFSVFSWARIRFPAGPAPAVRAPLGVSLREGIRFMFGDRLILSSITLDLVAVLFGGALAMLPVFAREVLGVGPRELGLLRAAPAAGSVLTALVLAHLGPLRHAGRALLGAVAGFGVCWILFALSRSFGLSLLLLLATGAFDNVSAILRNTLVQTRTPGPLMGRAQAVNGLFIGSSNELGAYESGLAAHLLGLVPSVVLGGCCSLLAAAVTAWKVPELRRLGRISRP
jgi:MFS family permease